MEGGREEKVGRHFSRTQEAERRADMCIAEWDRRGVVTDTCKGRTVKGERAGRGERETPLFLLRRGWM